MLLRSGSASDVGRVRASNQDLAIETPTLFAVADGMGGHVGGEVASRLAIEALARVFARQPTTTGLLDAVAAANSAVWEQGQARSDLRGMGTTLVAVALVPDDEGRDVLALANIGDSRAYVFHHGQLAQVTADHSVSEELHRKGELTRAEADVHPQRHILTRALGVVPRVNPDAWHLRLSEGDRLLLCTDGLTNELGFDQIAAVLRTEPDPERAAHVLVSQAIDHGGSDNVTIVVVDVLNGEAAGPLPAAPLSTKGLLPLPPVATGTANEDANPPIPAVFTEEAGAIETATWMSRLDPVPAPAWAAPKGPRRNSGRPSLRHSEDSLGPPPRRAFGPGSRRLTLGSVAFFILFIAVLSGAYGATRWYALDSYYVGLHANELDIFQGRPGGVLWFQPTMVRRTGVTTADVEKYRLVALRAGVQESSFQAAEGYVRNLVAETASLRTPATGGGAPSATAPSVPVTAALAPTPPDGRPSPVLHGVLV